MTQPPRSVTDLVDKRDDQRCVRCGRHIDGGSRHHRKLRSQGGPHAVENLILLCGSGTTGCHGWTHHNVAQARMHGLIVPSWQEPDETPVLTWKGWLLLLNDGTTRTLSVNPQGKSS